MEMCLKKSPISVVTWNVLWVPEGRDSRLKGIADAVAAIGPDVFCIQEAWTGCADDLASELGMKVACLSDGPVQEGGDSGVAVLVGPDIQVLRSISGFLPEVGDNGYWTSFASSVLDFPGRQSPVVVHTAHLPWGSCAAGARLAGAVHVEKLARGFAEDFPGALQLFTGDFNEVPAGAALAFLRGEYPAPCGMGTLWVDAWDVAGDGAGYTSEPLALPLAYDTARSVGIKDPAEIPNRRIDYVMVRGWVYGKSGYPLRAELIPGGRMSDHHGVFVEVRA